MLANVDLKTIGNRLSHSDPRLTLAVYAQATAGADRAAADCIGDRFAEALAIGDRDRNSRAGNGRNRPSGSRVTSRRSGSVLQLDPFDGLWRSLVSALRSGRRGPRFKSGQPDHRRAGQPGYGPRRICELEHSARIWREGFALSDCSPVRSFGARRSGLRAAPQLPCRPLPEPTHRRQGSCGDRCDRGAPGRTSELLKGSG